MIHRCIFTNMSVLNSKLLNPEYLGLRPSKLPVIVLDRVSVTAESGGGRTATQGLASVLEDGGGLGLV
jgi:hypothetical protein